jgi:homeobox-leucine zipper protein
MYCSNLLPCQPEHTYATLSDFLGMFLKNCVCWEQLCSGIDENAVGVCSQLVFAPVDVTLSDDVPLLPSGFRVIPLDCHLIGGSGFSRTRDLASALEGGPEVTGLRTETGTGSSNHLRSVLTIAFQFAYEAHTRENCAAVARQYVRSVVASVQVLLYPSREPFFSLLLPGVAPV